jgi:hypothetical protein
MISPKAIYTHRVYVDFSGDFGDPRVAGSSKTVCIAWVLTSEEDRKHNEKVLMDIKKSIGCKRENEIKYRSLRRHTKKDQALAQLANLKIGAVIVTVLKDVKASEKLTSREIAIAIHGFPWNRINRHLSEITPVNEVPNLCTQLVFDQVGWSHFKGDLINEFTKDSNVFKVSPDECIKFLDSKRTPLLQVADIIAGMCRDYIESIDRSDLIPCQVCWAKGWSSHPGRCRKGNLRRNVLLKTKYPMLLKDKDGRVFEMGLISRPPEAKW